MSNTLAERHSNDRYTFPVDAVAPAEKPIWTETLREHVAKRFCRKVLLLPHEDKAVTNGLQGRWLDLPSTHPVSASLVNRCHPLIDSVTTAFAQHYPLMLSPDCIWMVIEQGFAHHIAENSESLRHRLVRHTGKRKLNADIDAVNLTEFEGAISTFSAQIRDNTDQVLHETLVCDFSTTTSQIRTASEVVLMDCYASYFQYAMTCVCGIPKITITGSVDDWKRVRARVEVLEAFGLDWWVNRLRPILDEFIATAEGRPQTEFWQAIYKPKKAYGGDVVTGWIADLFPYLKDVPPRFRNPILKYERQDWAVPVEKGVQTRFGFEPGAEKGLSRSSFPSGLSSVPITLKLSFRKKVELDLVGGFLGVEQDPEDLALSPVISWAAAAQAPAKPVMVF
jgi:hypothetical protein